MNKWQVNIKIWQDDIKFWHVNIIIWQLMAEICHHHRRILHLLVTNSLIDLHVRSKRSMQKLSRWSLAKIIHGVGRWMKLLNSVLEILHPKSQTTRTANGLYRGNKFHELFSTYLENRSWKIWIPSCEPFHKSKARLCKRLILIYGRHAIIIN